MLILCLGQKTQWQCNCGYGDDAVLTNSPCQSTCMFVCVSKSGTLVIEKKEALFCYNSQHERNVYCSIRNYCSTKWVWHYGFVCLNFHCSNTRVPCTYRKPTYCAALSINWNSLDLWKQAITPSSFHSSLQISKNSCNG